MKRPLALACLAACLLSLPVAAAAQDVAITNVRIVVGTGSVIESGTIVVRGGKIASVGPGVTNTQGLTVINGAGMTAVPGYIDGHKHVNNFNADQMRSLLEAGTTTVLAGGGPAEQNLALAEHIAKGEWIGPRVIASGAVNLRQTPGEARAAVQALAKMGVKHTGEIGLTPEPAPPQAEIETLKAIVDEAKKVGVQVNVHAVSSPAMVAAVDAGVTRLVHLPTNRRSEWRRPDRLSPA
jgi:imidazolonepropionase-like amidohydrolase